MPSRANFLYMQSYIDIYIFANGRARVCNVTKRIYFPMRCSSFLCAIHYFRLNRYWFQSSIKLVCAVWVLCFGFSGCVCLQAVCIFVFCFFFRFSWFNLSAFLYRFFLSFVSIISFHFDAFRCHTTRDWWPIYDNC